jgi:hypothetical protein
MRRWFKRPWFWLAVAASTALIGLLCSTAGPFRSVSGRGELASEANARLWNCLVLADATDVWYISTYRFTRVECTLERESFEAWCRQLGWRLGPIEGNKPVYLSTQRDGLRTIRRGLQFDALNGALGFTGWYDPEARRAYVTYSGG